MRSTELVSRQSGGWASSGSIASGLAARDSASSISASASSAASGYTTRGEGRSDAFVTPSSTRRSASRCRTRIPPWGMSCTVSSSRRTARPSSISSKQHKRRRLRGQSVCPVRDRNACTASRPVSCTMPIAPGVGGVSTAKDASILQHPPSLTPASLPVRDVLQQRFPAA